MQCDATAFRYGAKEIITQEYRTISTNFPHLQVMHPSAVAKKFLSSEIPVFDFIFTFSSLEHSGNEERKRSIVFCELC